MTLYKVTYVSDTEATPGYSAEYKTILLQDYTRKKEMPIKSEDSNVHWTYFKLNIVFPAVRSQLSQHVFESEAQSVLLQIIKTC